MKYLYTLTLLAIQSLVFGQSFLGKVNEDYSITIDRSSTKIATPRNNPNSPLQIADFPKGFRANEDNKNFRNVALEDINQDGIQDILFSAGNTFMVISKGEILWTKPLVGVGIYPPSIADIDNDGDLEVIQVTGGNRQKGRIYAMDHEGNNLPGFPKSYNDNWLLTTATLSDLDGDRQLEIIFLERSSPGGNIHILKNNGEVWSKDWPLRLPGTPAITPSIADIDNDGEKEIVVSSTTVLYAFNLQAELEDGWPLDNPDTKFSFQSPILIDLDGDQDLEIIGSTHWNKPEYYILHHDGTPYKVWPFFVPNQEWTFSTPTVVKIDEETRILMSRPKNEDGLTDMLYSWNEEGDLQDGFPIESESGFQGIISVADIDDDGEMEYIFGSNRLDENGYGFIHAVNTDGSGEVEGFPLRPKGWTILNGAALGDVDGDGQMDLSAISYTIDSNAPDSIFLNVYNLETSYHSDKVLWTAYKGSNSRDGNMAKNLVSSISSPTIEGLKVTILPNPIIQDGTVELTVDKADKFTGELYTSNGQLVKSIFSGNYQKGTYIIALPKLSTGLYFLKISSSSNKQLIKKITAFSN